MRLFNARVDYGLAFLVRFDDPNACFYQSSGFRLYLSSIGEAPIISRKYSFINPEEDVQIILEPTLITASDDLRKYDPNNRQCFFNSESQLRFFKIYTQNNCELESVANFTLLACGCVRFSMPYVWTLNHVK